MDYLNEPSGKVFGSYNLNDYFDIFAIVTFIHHLKTSVTTKCHLSIFATIKCVFKFLYMLNGCFRHLFKYIFKCLFQIASIQTSF